MPEGRISRVALRLCGWLLIAGLLISGAIGTGTDMTWQWPGYLLLGAAALCGVFAGGWRQSLSLPLPGGNAVSRSRFGDICFALAAIFCGYVVLRALASPVAYFGREDAALALAWLLVYGLTATVLGGLRQRISLIKALTLLAVANLGIGFYQFSGHQEFSIFPGAVRSYGERIGGVFFNPNHLAAFLAVVAPLLLSLVLFGRGRPVYRFLFTLVAVLSIIAIGLTRSRGGMLALTAGLATMLVLGLPTAWLFWKRHLSGRSGSMVALLAVALLGVIGLGAMYANGQALQQRFGANAFRLEVNRQLFWEAALAQHEQAESPSVGAGSRAFRYEGRRLRSPEIHVSVTEAEFVHNDWLQLLDDYGWCGVGLLAVVVLAHGGCALVFLRADLKRKFLEVERESRPLQNNHVALVIGACAALIALGVQAVFDFHLHTPGVALWSALLFALLAAPRPEGEPIAVRRSSRSRSAADSHPRTGRPQSRSPRQVGAPPEGETRVRGIWLVAPLRGLAALAGLALLLAGATFVRSEWHFEKARLAFEGGDDFLAMAHLLEVRQLDARNPYAQSLSGQAHLLAAHRAVALPEAVRRAWLKRAGRHFMESLTLYPQDIHAMMGLARVFDGLGQNEDSLRVLENAQLWAPLYGNIAQMRAEQLHVMGRYGEAAEAYEAARAATAFGDSAAALRGLALLAEDSSGELDGGGVVAGAPVETEGETIE